MGKTGQSLAEQSFSNHEESPLLTTYYFMKGTTRHTRVLPRIVSPSSDLLVKKQDNSKKVKVFEEFMHKWGPDVQRKRDERDARWDEMIKVLQIQERNKNEV